MKTGRQKIRQAGWKDERGGEREREGRHTGKEAKKIRQA